MRKRFLLVFGIAFGAASFAAGPAAQAQTTPPPPTIVRQAPPTAPAAPPQPMAVAAPFTVNHYDLQLGFNFPSHQLEITAKVTLVPSQPLSSATFRLNQNLLVQSVTDASGAALGQQREQDQIIVTFLGAVPAATPTSLTFHYAGVLADANLSPISGIRTAYVGPEGAFLLYPGEWFPIAGFGTDRFTADISANLPAGMALVGSGTATTTPQPDGTVSYQIQQTQPSFPGTVVVSPLRAQSFNDAGLTTSVYFSPDVPASLAQGYATAAAQIYAFLAQRLGAAPTHSLQFVELPADALPSFSSPDLIVLSKTSIGSAVNPNLLTDEIAQQWYGVMVSPATMNDAWLQYGAARFCESLYVEQTQGKAAWQDLVTELEVGALSYPDTALANSAQLYVFSPAFQDLNYDKGAMLFHMLRWQLGDDKLMTGMRDFAARYAWKPATTNDFEAVLEQDSKTDLRSFFSQWYRGTAVPEFTNQYTTSRLLAGGYRVTGKIQQNLDLFRMPVDVRVETDGATENKTVEVEGASGIFNIDTSSRPRKITIDPDNWILKSSSDIALRVDLSRGDNLAAAGDYPGAVNQYKAALQLNPISSLAYYRIGEAYFQQQNWQPAADAYRQALNGDLIPSWVEVWSHIQLGKIFDASGQRDRALNEYQQAVATHDDTSGAQAVARQYMQAAYRAGTP